MMEDAELDLLIFLSENWERAELFRSLSPSTELSSQGVGIGQGKQESWGKLSSGRQGRGKEARDEFLQRGY